MVNYILTYLALAYKPENFTYPFLVMKQYSDLATMLFNIKKLTLPTFQNENNVNAGHMSANDLGKQLRKDLDNLKKELFGSRVLSALDIIELRKINEKLMVKFSVLRRKFEKTHPIVV